MGALYINGKSIVSNAKPHAKKRYVFNLDIEDFFPSINFGRVRGLFMSYPYYLPKEAATILAQICTYENELPQGAPTSPIISNMICVKMDKQLMKLAYDTKSYYTRYADDMTFSTTLRMFPSELAYNKASGEIVASSSLTKVIIDNGFKINNSKIRLQKSTQSQQVTGLTINQMPNVKRTYIRNIRAMLHSWEKYGLDKAEEEYLSKYNYRNKDYIKPCFQDIVKGKINFVKMVKSEDSKVFRNLAIKYNQLAGSGFSDYTINQPSEEILLQIYTEGKNTEHIEKAIHILDKDLSALIYNGKIKIVNGVEHRSGDQQLKTTYEIMSKSKNSNKFLFVWDCDSKNKINSLVEENNFFKFVFAFNTDNTKIEKGIENLYPESLFTQDLYTLEETKNDYGGKKSEEKFNKPKFLKKIKEETAPHVFENFKPLFRKIRDILDMQLTLNPLK